jgi:hypothetical protein
MMTANSTETSNRQLSKTIAERDHKISPFVEYYYVSIVFYVYINSWTATARDFSRLSLEMLLYKVREGNFSVSILVKLFRES